MKPCRLHHAGWNKGTRARLERLIRDGSGKNLPVVFDFDNTIVCGDIGEATLAVLAKSGMLKRNLVSRTISPSFRGAGKGIVSLNTSADQTAYYEKLLVPTVHGESDPTPLSNAYVWAVEILQGLRPLDVVEATRSAFQIGLSKGAFVEVTPGKTRFLAPFFYEPMVELIALLLRHRFDVWIVSASNVWSVRWMVLNGLNPKLREAGVRNGVASNRVIGISTLLTDHSKRLYKDAVLVRTDRRYASLDKQRLGGFRLTTMLQFPVPTYSGKVGCIFDAIGRRPYLAVGDSPGDHAMLAYAENRLWLARLEKPDFQKLTARVMSRTGSEGWLVQPLLANASPGFISDLSDLASRLGHIPNDIQKAAAFLSSGL